MKKNCLVIVLILFGQLVFSQSTPKDSLTKLMAADICKEIAANEANLKASENWQMDLGMLMLPVFSNYSDALEKLVPGFTMNGSSIESLSKEIGMVIGLNCPVFLKLISGDKTKLQALIKDGDEKVLKGTLLKFETGEFTSVHIKMPNGKIEKLWWMGYFDGANQITEKARLNKQVTIVYREQEIFNAALNEYVNTKIVAAASF